MSSNIYFVIWIELSPERSLALVKTVITVLTVRANRPDQSWFGLCWRGEGSDIWYIVTGRLGTRVRRRVARVSTHPRRILLETFWILLGDWVMENLLIHIFLVPACDVTVHGTLSGNLPCWISLHPNIFLPHQCSPVLLGAKTKVAWDP